MSDRSYEEGLKVRREVLGEAHVERASAEGSRPKNASSMTWAGGRSCVIIATS